MKHKQGIFEAIEQFQNDVKQLNLVKSKNM